MLVGQGMDITSDLRRMCPALTLQQLYRLTEYHHDDWIATGGQSTDTILLLEALKRIVDGFSGQVRSSRRACAPEDVRQELVG